MTNTSYHQKLSLDDKKPICSLCNEESLYYCTMNDEYYCVKHVLGHDENELLLYFLKDHYLDLSMEEAEHNSRIEKIAEIILSDNISLDEQEQNKLKKYHIFAMQNYGLNQDEASELVNEAFLYLKLKQAPDIDPLTKGDEFGAGFS